MRCTPAVRRLRALVDEGRIGQVRNVRADLGFALSPTPARATGPRPRRQHPARHRRLPADLRDHAAGRAPRAHRAGAVLTERGIDDAAGLVLTYGSGAIASVTCAQNATTDSTATVTGDRGRIEVAAPLTAPPLLRAWSTAESPRWWPSRMIGVGMAHEAIEVQRCLRAGLTESPLVPLAETLLVARLLDRARQVCGVRLPGDG